MKGRAKGQNGDEEILEMRWRKEKRKTEKGDGRMGVGRKVEMGKVTFTH